MPCSSEQETDEMPHTISSAQSHLQGSSSVPGAAYLKFTPPELLASLSIKARKLLGVPRCSSKHTSNEGNLQRDEEHDHSCSLQQERTETSTMIKTKHLEDIPRGPSSKQGGWVRRPSRREPERKMIREKQYVSPWAPLSTKTRLQVAYSPQLPPAGGEYIRVPVEKGLKPFNASQSKNRMQSLASIPHAKDTYKSHLEKTGIIPIALDPEILFSLQSETRPKKDELQGRNT